VPVVGHHQGYRFEDKVGARGHGCERSRGERPAFGRGILLGGTITLASYPLSMVYA
jgi:hypothetical protein